MSEKLHAEGKTREIGVGPLRPRLLTCERQALLSYLKHCRMEQVNPDPL